jgi:hypothetical protein
MQKISSLTVAQLQRAVSIKQQIENLQRELDSMTEESGVSTIDRRGSYGRSAEVRARMAAAQKARWAKIKENGADESDADVKPRRKKHKMSAAGRAAIGAAAKARWAKIKAGKEANA